MKTRMAETALIEKVSKVGRDFTSNDLGMGRNGWRRLNALVKIGVLKIRGKVDNGGSIYRFTGNIVMMLMAIAVCAQPLPMPSGPDVEESAFVGPPEPETHPATIAWSHDGPADGFRMSVSNAVLSYIVHLDADQRTNVVQSINGENSISITATNRFTESAPVVLRWSRSSVDIFQLWMHNASLQPDHVILSITNPVGSGLYSLKPTATNATVIEEIR